MTVCKPKLKVEKELKVPFKQSLKMLVTKGIGVDFDNFLFGLHFFFRWTLIKKKTESKDLNRHFGGAVVRWHWCT